MGCSCRTFHEERAIAFSYSTKCDGSHILLFPFLLKSQHSDINLAPGERPWHGHGNRSHLSSGLFLRWR
jgi:hypothetical protein